MVTLTFRKCLYMPWEEQRKHKRVVTVVPVLISGELFDAKGYTINLSTGGCAIDGFPVPKKGQHLQLLLQVPKPDMPINIQLAVVTWSAPGKFGVEFIRVSALHQKGLKRYLYKIDLCPSQDTGDHPEGADEKTEPR